MRGEAVARHDVEANSGQQHHALPLGLGIAQRHRLKDVNFPRDVEIVNSVADTRSRHWPRRRGKRAGDTEYDRNVPERRIKDRGGAEIERASDQPKRFGDRFHLFDISSG